MEGGERAGACPWWGRGEVALPPPLEIGKKDAVRGNFNHFHLCFTYEIRGESIHCTSKMEGWADRRVSIVEEGEGLASPPPPRNGKKNVVRRNCNLFHLCFTNEIRGDRQTLAAYMQTGRGWADKRLSMVGGGRGDGALPSPPRKKKRGCQEEILTAFTYVLLIK